MVNNVRMERSLNAATNTFGNPTEALSTFAAELTFDKLPGHVVDRAEDLMLDWAASALAGRGARPVRILESLTYAMGPPRGPSEILTSRRTTSPLFAALINAAGSHTVEQDDLHNGSVLHPGTVIFPAALAAAQDVGASGRQLIVAVVTGYEVGIRVGEFLGRSHYKVFHTTATAGTVAAAVATAHVLGLDARRMRHAIGSAGTQAAGLWEFLRDAADSKQLHAAKAAANGLLAAYIARDGFTGASDILAGRQGMGAGLSTDADPARLRDGLGHRWALTETSFKVHASCRHTHPAADAFLALIREHRLEPDDIRSVTAYVHQAAIDLLGAVTIPQTVHQSKFSMGFVLALVALRGRAALTDFDDAALHDRQVRAFHDRVRMELDPDIDRAYPRQWIGRVSVRLRDGRELGQRVFSPKGDPDNTLTRAEVVAKAAAVAAYGGGATPDEVASLTERILRLRLQPKIGRLLPDDSSHVDSVHRCR